MSILKFFNQWRHRKNEKLKRRFNVILYDEALMPIAVIKQIPWKYSGEFGMIEVVQLFGASTFNKSPGGWIRSMTEEDARSRQPHLISASRDIRKIDFEDLIKDARIPL